MKISLKNVKKFQEGGPMPAEAPMEKAGAPVEGGAPAEGGQDQMLAQLQQMAQQIIQQLGPDAAAALAQMIMEMLQGGGAAPEEGAPAEEGQPVYRAGGVLSRRVRK